MLLLIVVMGSCPLCWICAGVGSMPSVSLRRHPILDNRVASSRVSLEQTHGVSTNGVTANYMLFDRLGTKGTPWHLLSLALQVSQCSCLAGRTCLRARLRRSDLAHARLTRAPGTPLAGKSTWPAIDEATIVFFVAISASLPTHPGCWFCSRDLGLGREPTLI